MKSGKPMETDLKTKTVKNIGFNAFANVASFFFSAIMSIVLGIDYRPVITGSSGLQ